MSGGAVLQREADHEASLAAWEDLSTVMSSHTRR